MIDNTAQKTSAAYRLPALDQEFLLGAHSDDRDHLFRDCDFWATPCEASACYWSMRRPRSNCAPGWFARPLWCLAAHASALPIQMC